MAAELDEELGPGNAAAECSGASAPAAMAAELDEELGPGNALSKRSTGS